MDLSAISPALHDVMMRRRAWGEGLHDLKWREFVEIVGRDVSGEAGFEETVARISSLADRIIEAALARAWSDTEGKIAAPVKDRSGFAVFAMGKLGAYELNYASDVDLIFCRRASADEKEARFYTRLGERLVHLLGQPGPEGFLYRVDMRLRPHGATGPLVPTIDSLENYYESWGEAWERQALIKVRAVCGDCELRARFARFARGFVFARQMDDSSLEEIKNVKHRSEREYARPGDRFHVKQGPGGIRDIEFYVQYLQLSAGSTHPEVRVPATLDAIRALASIKALLDGEEAQLSLSYQFLRIVEHRLQLRMMSPQALIPENAAELGLLAGGLGYGSLSTPETGAFLEALRACRTRVRAILERIYLTPGHMRPREREEEFAQLLSERTPKERAREILGHYGFRDCDKAWQNLRLMALGPAGSPLPPGERRAFLEIVYPILEVLRDSYDPDHGLHHLESFAAATGNRVSFLRTLASRRPHLARLTNLLALSNLGHQILLRHPEYFDSLARGIHLHEGRCAAEMKEELEGRMREAPAGQSDLVMRRYRQREMLRIAYRDLAGLAGSLDISRELSDLAEACLTVALESFPDPGGRPEAPPIWTIGMGKFGSRQMHYSSDLDLMFIYDDLEDDSSPELRTAYQRRQDKVLEQMLERLSGVTAEGMAYKVDLRLRPEGGVGLLARSWSSFLDHARNFMQPWERMALIRSRVLAVGRAAARWEEARDEIVYSHSWTPEELASLRHLKRRMETELNKENRIYIDFKFGTGGINDLEYLVQRLQLQHGARHAAVRTPNTAEAIAALRDLGVIPEPEGEQLLSAQQFHRSVENRFQLIEEWNSREISRESPLLDRLARSLGYDSRKPFLQEWHRVAAMIRNLKAATNNTK
jgi:glutamate-ammonia-ligase adenylyltransferase